MYYSVDTFFKTSFDLINGNSKSKNNLPGTCIPLEKRMYLDVRGNIYPCERVDQQHIIGRVNGNCVDINIDTIKQKYIDLYNSIKKQCNTCFNTNTCSNCLLKGNSEKNTLCANWHGKERHEVKVNSTFDYLRENRKLYQKIAEEIFIA